MDKVFIINLVKFMFSCTIIFDQVLNRFLEEWTSVVLIIIDGHFTSIDKKILFFFIVIRDDCNKLGVTSAFGDLKGFYLREI